MRPLRFMVGRGVVTVGAQERPPLAVLEARAAEQAQARVRELEARIAAQTEELRQLSAKLAAAEREKAPAPVPKKKRKSNGERKR
jgi:Tfp pilus assembly protein FimV